MRANILSVYPNKTVYLLFNSRNINLQVININLDSDIISPSYFAKNSVFYFRLICHLIIIFHLSFLFVQLRDFRRNRPLISETAAITLANSFIHSRVDYCNSLFYGLTNYSIHRLQKVQNIAARIVIRSVHSSYITPVLKSLHWLPVNYRINFKIFCTTHRALSLHEPHYVSSLFSLRFNSHSLRSSSFSPLLLTYFNKKSHGFRSSLFAAPHLWNHLPNNIRTAPTYMSFRKNLKTSLFNLAFST